MSTLSSSEISAKLPEKDNRLSAGQIARRVGWGLLKFVGGLIVLLSMLPVVLLPVATAVPWYGWVALGLIDAGLIYILLTLARTFPQRLLIVAAILAVSVLAVFLSQWFAATPPIVGADGRSIPGSIAELEPVELNGSRQWITIRGHDQTRPVLLFLAGGPGGSQLAATR
jgi:hypothetical protein